MIEDALRSIQIKLDLIISEIQQTECYVSNANIVKTYEDGIKRLWYQYAVVSKKPFLTMSFIKMRGNLSLILPCISCVFLLFSSLFMIREQVL